MSRAKEWFPDLEKNGYFDTYILSYRDIVEKFGDVLFSESFGSYQGDCVFILKKENKIGYSVQSYGSCSGCDWLQSIASYDRLDELIDAMESRIEWYDTPQDLLDRLKSLTEKNPAYIHEEYWNDVYNQANKLLSVL